MNIMSIHTTYLVRMSRSHFNHLYDLIPVENYFEEIGFLDGKWERDFESDFFIVIEDVPTEPMAQDNSDDKEHSVAGDDDFQADDYWGPSDWSDYLGCDQDSLDDYFENQLC
jgi:hypothetical protein